MDQDRLTYVRRQLATGKDFLMTPGEVAELFVVDSKTISRWAKAGRLKAERTLGGHRRFRWSDVSRKLSPEFIAALRDGKIGDGR